jgi:hypothetical protein
MGLAKPSWRVVVGCFGERAECCERVEAIDFNKWWHEAEVKFSPRTWRAHCLGV